MYYYDDLVEASLKRILAGLIKYVAGGMDGFIMKYNSFKNGVHHVPSFNDSCPTIAVQNRLGACFISRFMLQRNSGKPKGRVFSIDSPARTLTATGGNLELVQCFLTKYYSTGTHNHQSIEDPAGAIGVKDTFGKIWLDKTFGGDRNHSSIDQPAGSITGNPHDRIMNAQWIDRNFRAGGQHSSMDEPVGAILQVPKLNLVSAEPFIMTTNYRGIFTSMNEPSPPLLASRRHHLIINPSHGGYCTSAEAPGPVIIARQDKAPLSLLEVIEGECYIPIYDDDSDTMIDIKVFMSIFGIKDIKMRMLKVLELLKIQGFPEDYILMGNQTEQKKGIGNSVAPAVPEHWAIAMHVGLTQHREAA
jgi:DNA (cytosine-5)-methyltransferase 1